MFKTLYYFADSNFVKVLKYLCLFDNLILINVL